MIVSIHEKKENAFEFETKESKLILSSISELVYFTLNIQNEDENLSIFFKSIDSLERLNKELTKFLINR
jgi:hypothetical protein